MINKEYDYMPIRRRLDKLKQESGMDAYEFCKIYAPERCKGAKDTARNYISAVFSGNASYNGKPVLPDIEHLLNIVNSEEFPNVTLNYLVYGDEEPAKTIERVDLNPEHWTLADFCVFMGRLLDTHWDIVFERHVKEVDDFESQAKEIKGLEDEDFSFFNLVIKIPEFFALIGTGYDLGIGLGEYLDAYKDMKDIKSEIAQKTMYKQIIKAVYDDERFSKQSLTTRNDSFTEYEDGGKIINGLNIE